MAIVSDGCVLLGVAKRARAIRRRSSGERGGRRRRPLRPLAVQTSLRATRNRKDDEMDTMIAGRGGDRSEKGEW